MMRRLRAPAVLVLIVGAGLVAVVSVLPRAIRRNRGLLRTGMAKRYNDFTRKTAGSEHSPFALLTHVGRRSGQTYETALGACEYGDGFLLPLGYGPQTDWYRNIMAAGTCRLAWKGRTYSLERPETVTGSDVVRAWPLRQQLTLKAAGMDTFVWLHPA
jgi:deazaflavin-dependent oxidoreductase (nitroreductase family)